MSGEAALVNQRVCRLDPNVAVLLPRFLMYGLNSHLAEIEAATSYTTVKHLSHKQIAAIEFPVPPLDEQQRIVTKLDQALGDVDALGATTQSVLDDIDALWSCYLADSFSPIASPNVRTPVSSKCPSVELAQLLGHQIGGLWGEPEGASEEDALVLRITVLRSNGGVDFSTAARRSFTKKQVESHRLRTGDILLEKSEGGPNTPVGRVAAEIPLK